MFKKTLRRLALLNSLVFLLIFIAFGSVLYGYLSYRLFDSIDDAMFMKAHALKIEGGRIARTRNPAMFDPRIFLLLRDVNGDIVNLYPLRTTEEDVSNMADIAYQTGTKGPQIKQFEEHVYRVVAYPYHAEENILNLDGRSIVIKDVIAISIVDSEVNLLQKLLWIILGGLVFGLAAIILAGYFLARRAMIPIQASWDRQQQFVADASHELRTPLTVIRSNAEMVLRHPDHAVEEESPRITNIMREAMRMTRLVSNLLTLARADANQEEVQLTAVHINEIVDTVVSQFRPLAEIRDICLVVDMKEELSMRGDKERLHQLVVILLDNALKYTTKQGEIMITCFKTGNNVEIHVKDTGCGIAPQDLPHIFDRFFRGDKARSRENGGTGLGLAIAKWIVGKHGGKISAESRLGQGTKIKVILPAKAV